MIFFTYAPKSYFPRNGSFSEHFVYGLIEPDLSSGSILINHIIRRCEIFSVNLDLL